MTKSQLIEHISLKLPHLPQRDVEMAINITIDVMTLHLAQGERIEIRGFGGFSVIERAARMGRNPKTGEQVSLPIRHSTHFKPGLDLRERVERSRAAVPINGD
ncbi:MAG: integration host factor subunit beta [Methylomonas sp.]|jgi:integration host factor subunit beta|uniref:integration host factor subunit beta n=1 Tax=Methylomonas sp. TaxID=418 RepID=UPI0025EF23F7|nr:integration host factor subunit beta [Methylomonas sp.]MCK9609507.1 integration host factor subunit beta [Methylomonas sp.]